MGLVQRPVTFLDRGPCFGFGRLGAGDQAFFDGVEGGAGRGHRFQEPVDRLPRVVELLGQIGRGLAQCHRFAAGEVAWIEVLGEARQNSRPLARYLALIVAAGVIASLGVITANSILIVGAMAVSPDLLPICATCVGIVGGRLHLARRAFTTLVLGLGLVVCVAALVTVALDLTGLLPSGFKVGQGGLGNLTNENSGYNELLNEDVSCFPSSFAARVVPFEPDQSFLVAKLQGFHDCGSGMPLSGSLSPEDVLVIRSWILDGAPKN